MKVWLTLTIGLAVALGMGDRLCAERVDQMIAVVNDEVITQRDFDEAINPYRQQLEEQYGGTELVERLEQIQQEVFSTLIEDRLILSAAKRMGFQVSEEEVEERLAEVKQQFESERAFEIAMASEGVGSDRLREIYRNQILTRKVVEKEVKSRVAVQPAEIAAYYQEHLSEFQRPATVHLSNILIRVGEGVDPAQARRRAEEAVGKLQTGVAFGDLARQYSEGPRAAEGGDLGLVASGHMRREIEEAIAAVEPGGYTPIVQTDAGFHIFAVHERRPAESLRLEEVQSQIEQLLRRQQFEERLREWLQKLRSRAYISTPGLPGES